MFMMFNEFICWLLESNTTLILYAALGPAINIGGIQLVLRKFQEKQFIRNLFWIFKSDLGPMFRKGGSTMHLLDSKGLC